MVIYDSERDYINVQGKIIEKDTAIKLIKYYYDLYIDYENKFNYCVQQNQNIPYKEQFFEYEKSWNTFEIECKMFNGATAKYDFKSFEYVIEEIEKNFDDYDEIATRFKIGCYFNRDHQNIINDKISSYSAYFCFPHRNNIDIFRIETNSMDGKEFLQKDIDFINNLTKDLPEKMDYYMKHKFIIQEVSSISVGFIVTTILMLTLLIFNINVEAMFNSANSFALFQLAGTFIIGNILMYLYISGLYKTIGISDYNGQEIQGYQKDYFEQLSEVHVGKGIEKKYARNQIKKIYNFSKKSLVIELAIFIIMYIILSIVL